MSSNRIGRIGEWGGNSNNTSNSRSGGRFASLRDLAPSGPSMGGGSTGHGSDDEEGEPGESAENWYAGGERSGLSIENPDRRPDNNVVRDILRKAAEAGAAPQPPSAASSSRIFTGSGYTLGSDETESIYVSDPTNHVDDAGDDQEVATRHISFWRNGFNVEDGPLMGYNDPANAQILEEINTGHAPPQILNVRVGQPVELRVTRRLNEDYVVPPKRPLAAFDGEGHRLGAVVPEVVSRPSQSAPSGMQAIPGAFPTSERTMIQTQFEVDQSQPTTSVQVRLADGTRLVARMNLSHTVHDIRNFINASQQGSSSVAYTINTTFPTRVLEDESQTIEKAGLKNSVVVQRLL